MTTTVRGKWAEDIVAQRLRAEGHKILDQNWRRRDCEIDIVSRRTNRRGLRKESVTYFVEVKFRGSSIWGSGFEYINSVKIQKMYHGAQRWCEEHSYEGAIEVLAAEVDSQGRVNMTEVG